MIRLIQANLQRKPRAHDALNLVAHELGADVLMVSEPNKRVVNGGGWIKDEESDVALYIRNRRLKVSGVKMGKGNLTLNLGDLLVTCCYLSPNISIEDYEARVEEIMNCSDRDKGHIVLGDINAKSPRWGSPTWDRRGMIWEEWLDARGLVVMNDGAVPTWRRGGLTSFIDVTCVTEEIIGRISNWKVLPEESLSDHAFITFDIGGDRVKPGPVVARRRLVDPMLLREALVSELGRLGEEPRSQDLVRAMQRAQDRATLRRRDGRVGNYPYWWNTEIEESRKDCMAARRRLSRIRNRGTDVARIEERYDEYREKRRVLAKLIKNSKKAHWEAMREDLENDIWGKGYQIVTRDLKKVTPYELTDDTKMDIARRLFPRVEDRWERCRRGHENFPRVTAREVSEMAKMLKKNKSPGPDGVTAETLQMTVELASESFARMYDELLERGVFPSEWKVARLVLIWKGKMPAEEPSSQRPLCLIDTTGKLLELIIKGRLVAQWEGRGGLSNRQFGFRKGLSTIKAAEFVQSLVNEARWDRMCALITIDIRNAFNTARWSYIIRELKAKGIDNYLVRIVEDYLRERKITVGKDHLDMTTGVPQGSVLGPLLWNILYDGVLRLEMPRGATTVAYADDLAVLVRAASHTEVEERGNDALARIDRWLEDHALAMAPEKSEAIFLKGYRRSLVTTFNIRGNVIAPKKSLNYLGITLDVQNTYGLHVQEKCNKAEKRLAALTRLMPNIGGPSQEKRLAYCNVVMSIVLYAAPVWRGALRIKRHLEKITRTQRGATLRVVMAYRTVSTCAIQVLAGIPPIDLLVDERCRNHESGEGHLSSRRVAERMGTLNVWQERWAAETRVAQWTKALIPDVRAWYRCSHRKLNYHLTQFFTGHGCFGSYLARIGKVADGRCRQCREEEDTPVHTVLKCRRWSGMRGSLGEEMGQTQQGASRLVQLMMASAVEWRRLGGIIAAIIKCKEEDERGVR